MSSYLSPVIDRFGECRVLCVGDVMLDKFVYGQVERISPEAPIPIFSAREERIMLGGAGNVACNLTALGAQVAFVSVIGDDPTGRKINSMIGKERNIVPYLLSEPGLFPLTKSRFVAGLSKYCARIAK